jgi:hypothetical protein
MNNSRAVELMIFDDKLAVSNRLVKYGNNMKDGIPSFQISANASLSPTGYQELGFTTPLAFEINPVGTKFRLLLWQRLEHRGV